MLPKIDVPVFETKLISNGKTIKFRPFLIKEQKLFLMALQSDEQKDVVDSIKQVLNNCIITPDINVDDLPSFDIENLFLQLRAKSVGEVVELRYTCNNMVKNEKDEEKRCGGVVKFDVNLLEVKPNKNPEHNSKIQLTEKLGLMMKYPNFNMLERYENSDSKDIFELIAQCIDYVYDENQLYYAKETTKEEMIEFIENLQQSDFQKIEKFFETMPKFEKTLEFKCPKCKHEENIELEGIQSFFV